METEMNLPGPALQEVSQLWEEEVTVTMMGTGGRHALLLWELKEEDINLSSRRSFKRT